MASWVRHLGTRTRQGPWRAGVSGLRSRSGAFIPGPAKGGGQTRTELPWMWSLWPIACRGKERLPEGMGLGQDPTGMDGCRDGGMQASHWVAT